METRKTTPDTPATYDGPIIRACPFCAYPHPESIRVNCLAVVECRLGCGARGPTAENRDDAIRLWNSRRVSRIMDPHPPTSAR